MIEAVVDAISVFVKRELEKISNRIELRDRKAQEKVREWLLTTGIHMAPLPEKAGGIGADDRLMAEVLMKLSEESASLAFSLLCHWFASLVAFKCGFKMDSEHFFLFKLPGSNFFAGFEFFGAALRIDEEGGVSVLSTSSVSRKRSTNLLGLNGVTFIEDSGTDGDKKFFDENVNSLFARFYCLMGAIACGNAESAFRSALQYAGERYQGGDLIINHGIVKQMLGSMKAKTYASMTAVREATMSDNIADKMISRVLACIFGEEVCRDAVQVFGGYGYMRDYPVERKYRDARTLALLPVGTGNLLIKALEADL